jgi:hypothetical protein
VLFKLRCPGSGAGLYNEAEVELDWAWSTLPREAENVLVDGAEFHVTKICWRLDAEPPVVIEAEVDAAVAAHKVDWLTGLGPHALRTFVDLPRGG